MKIFTRQKKVKCKLQSGSYDIIIGANLNQKIGELIQRNLKLKSNLVMVVTTKKVAKFYEKTVGSSLRRAGFKVTFYYLPDGETAKSEKHLFAILKELIQKKFDRNSLLIGLGGGVVGDVTGLAASLFMRGIAFVNIPTTLLAQVDSSIGGKTGINLKEGKNLVGTFYQPQLVISDVATIATLPRSELINGLAEVIKYGILFERDFFDFLEENLQSVFDLDPDVIEYIVHKCSQFKVRVVERDEREGGLRAVLNLGHTFGHAIEAYMNYKTISHGMAVALGMIAAARLANELEILTDEAVDRIVRIIQLSGLPDSIEEYDLDISQLAKLMLHDKKNVNKKICLILPVQIGNVIIRDDISTAQIKKAMRF